MRPGFLDMRNVFYIGLKFSCALLFISITVNLEFPKLTVSLSVIVRSISWDQVDSAGN